MNRWFVNNNVIYCLIIGIFILSVSYETGVLMTNDVQIIKSMIDIDLNIGTMNLTEALIYENIKNPLQDSDSWRFYDKYLGLFIFLKILFTALTLSCPIPGGVYAPALATGAVIGQLYASVLIKVLSFYGIKNYIQYRGVYAIMGSAAYAGSVTRTLSTAIIVLELNGNLSHSVPLMICVLTSNMVSELIYPESFFEMLSSLDGLERKLALKEQILVSELLDKNIEYRTLWFLSLKECT